MPDNEAHHIELHHKINGCRALADWIYHDLRLDCDGEASGRTGDRLTAIGEQHGNDGLYGVAGSWAENCVHRISRASRKLGRDIFPEKVVQPELDKPPSEMDEYERGKLTATQFIVAIGNDDLEMAEAMFNAVASTESMDEVIIFMGSVLKLCIAYSNYVKELERARRDH